MKKVILLTVSVLLISLAYSFAEVPCKINYQGRLIENNVPVDGTKTMKFTIYNSLQGGEELWTSGNVDITVYNGLFRYVLGEGVIDDSPVDDLSGIKWTAGQELYLEVIVDGEPLTPLEAIYAYPYAINSHLLEGEAKDYFINTSVEIQKKDGGLNIMGDVGIGTTSPGAKLDVAGAIYADSVTNDNSAGGLTVGGSGGANIELFGSTSPYGRNAYYDAANHYFRDYDASPTRMAITSSGNVGIGTTSPGEKLTVAGTIESTTGGVKFPDGSVQTTAAGGFGVWNDRDGDGNPDSLAAGVTYTAETDGLVFASFLIGDPGERALYGYTPAGTLVTKDGGWSTNSASITMPVRKGDTWKVTGQYSGNGYIRVFWMPIGD